MLFLVLYQHGPRRLLPDQITLPVHMEPVLLEDALLGPAPAVEHGGGDIDVIDERIPLGQFGKVTVGFLHLGPKPPPAGTGFDGEDVEPTFGKLLSDLPNKGGKGSDDLLRCNSLGHIVIPLVEKDGPGLIGNHHPVGIVEDIVHIASAKASGDNRDRSQVLFDLAVPSAHTRRADTDHGPFGGRILFVSYFESLDRLFKSSWRRILLVPAVGGKDEKEESDSGHENDLESYRDDPPWSEFGLF